jgi:hypothetical protein
MAFCPNCGFEYVSNVFQTKQREHTFKGDFVLLRNVPSRLYAQMLQEALKNQGIASMIKGDEGYPLRTTTAHIPISKITVWVSKENLAKAQVITDQMLDHI